MKKFNTAKLTFALLGIMTVACAAGSIGSTLAWYAYSTRALVSYSGTSVASTRYLQIGIASDEKIEGMPNGISEVTFSDDLDSTTQEYSHYYYFATTGTGLTYDVIAKYLTAKGYATNEMEPTTSGTYVTGVSDFSLKKSPNQTVHGNTVAAEKKNYLTIPFVFRIITETANGGTAYVPNQELWLSKAVARANSDRDGNIYKALRIFIDRDDNIYGEKNDFIFNPSAGQDGRTRVGGLLNLAGTSYFDYDNYGEVLYGEFDPAALDTISQTGYEGEDILHDVNGTGNHTKITTFTAKHCPHTKYYSSLNDNLFGHADYKCPSSIAPERDDQDFLSNADESHPTSVCKTDSNNHDLARVDMTIYLEGWDFSVIDEEQKHKFDLGLTFEISRVQ